jgi:hypothetical protein
VPQLVCLEELDPTGVTLAWVAHDVARLAAGRELEAVRRARDEELLAARDGDAAVAAEETSNGVDATVGSVVLDERGLLQREVGDAHELPPHAGRGLGVVVHAELELLWVGQLDVDRGVVRGGARRLLAEAVRHSQLRQAKELVGGLAVPVLGVAPDGARKVRRELVAVFGALDGELDAAAQRDAAVATLEAANGRDAALVVRLDEVILVLLQVGRRCQDPARAGALREVVQPEAHVGEGAGHG